ncbi:hypothetical protein [uncultured Roseobacter sp.]|nr:hypothetical protein [uncultured Roseobacter sp.]
MSHRKTVQKFVLLTSLHAGHLLTAGAVFIALGASAWLHMLLA